jgi:hypothetical protein
VKPFSRIERDFLLGRIRVAVVWDSIWRGYEPSDLVVVKRIGRPASAVPNYLKGLLPNADLAEKFEFVTTSRMTSIQLLLERAADTKLSRLSLTPVGGGRYRQIADEIRRWSGDYPKEVFLYHLNRNDFEYFKALQADWIGRLEPNLLAWGSSKEPTWPAYPSLSQKPRTVGAS